MTNIEAFKQAMREYGDDDETIERRVKEAQEQMPFPTNGYIPKEREREYIDHLIETRKKIQALFEENPLAAVEAIEKRLQEFNQKN